MGRLSDLIGEAFNKAFMELLDRHSAIVAEFDKAIIDCDSAKTGTKYSREKFEGFKYRFTLSFKVGNKLMDSAGFPLYSNSDSYQELKDFIDAKIPNKVLSYEIKWRTPSSIKYTVENKNGIYKYSDIFEINGIVEHISIQTKTMAVRKALKKAIINGVDFGIDKFPYNTFGNAHETGLWKEFYIKNTNDIVFELEEGQKIEVTLDFKRHENIETYKCKTTDENHLFARFFNLFLKSNK